ncbi:hypothetical protein MHU86_198 [Fragilaria crotonensis]|nr:hypothetical protein MHU86_198 [Fragilaria crotonensis]
MPANLPSILGTLFGGASNVGAASFAALRSSAILFVAPSPAAIASQQLLGPKPRALPPFTMTLVSCITYSSNLLNLRPVLVHDDDTLLLQQPKPHVFVLADNVEPTQQLPPLSLSQLGRNDVLPLQHLVWRHVRSLVDIAEPTQPFGCIFLIAFLLSLSCCRFLAAPVGSRALLPAFLFATLFLSSSLRQALFLRCSNGSCLLGLSRDVLQPCWQHVLLLACDAVPVLQLLGSTLLCAAFHA